MFCNTHEICCNYCVIILFFCVIIPSPSVQNVGAEEKSEKGADKRNHAPAQNIRGCEAYTNWAPSSATRSAEVRERGERAVDGAGEAPRAREPRAADHKLRE